MGVLIFPHSLMHSWMQKSEHIKRSVWLSPTVTPDSLIWPSQKVLPRQLSPLGVTYHVIHVSPWKHEPCVIFLVTLLTTMCSPVIWCEPGCLAWWWRYVFPLLLGNNIFSVDATWCTCISMECKHGGQAACGEADCTPSSIVMNLWNFTYNTH